MSHSQDENRRLLEDKYRRFKQAQLDSMSVHTSILTPRDLNTQTKPEICPDSLPGSTEAQEILTLLAKEPKIYEVMLIDPRIYQLSQCLRIQAEENNKSQLISAFPQRYKQLLEIEAKHLVLETSMKDRNDQQSKIVGGLKQQLQSQSEQLQQLTLSMQSLQHQIRVNEQQYYTEIGEQARKKEAETGALRDHIANLEKRHEKAKNEYRHLSEVVLELREHEEEAARQAHRMAQKMQELEEKVVRAHKKLLECQSEKNIEIEALRKQHQQTIRQRQDGKQGLLAEMQQLSVRIQYKESLLLLCEQQHARVQSQLEQEILTKGQQLTHLRQEHLEAIKTIEELDSRVDDLQAEAVRERHAWDIERVQLRKQLDKCYKCIGELQAEVEAKVQLIATLQKNMQGIRDDFLRQATSKSEELSHKTQLLAQLQRQIQINQKQTQAILNQSEKAKVQLREIGLQKAKLQSQYTKMQETIITYGEKLKESDQKMKKFSENYAILSEKVKRFLKTNNKNRNGDNLNPESQQHSILIQSKLEKYEALIQKLRLAVTELTLQSRANSSKQTKIMRQLVSDNIKMRKQLLELNCLQ